MDHSHLRLFNPNGSEPCPSPTISNPRANNSTESLAVDKPTAARADRPAVTYSRVVGEARVAVSVGDLMPILAEAWESRRAWLGDFSNDRVIVSQDLYEIMLAYKRLKVA